MKITSGTIPSLWVSTAGDTTETQSLSEKKQCSEFESWMKRLDAMEESPEDRARRKARENKESQLRRDKLRKQNELQSRIAYLRSKIISSQGDEGTAAELSMAKTQLFWVSSNL